jgi:uncharacterized damage-inducible protein DinB
VSIGQMMLAEYEMESAGTRKALERVPDDKLGWKPHEKSMSLGDLAAHLAEAPGWMSITLEKDSFDVAPPDGSHQYQRPNLKSRQEILDLFDKNLKQAKEALAKAPDSEMMKPWSLMRGGQAMFTMPRVAVVRSFVMNHNIHHRAQLGVYLRLNGIPVPGHYGPSADETM